MLDACHNRRFSKQARQGCRRQHSRLFDASARDAIQLQEHFDRHRAAGQGSQVHLQKIKDANVRNFSKSQQAGPSRSDWAHMHLAQPQVQSAVVHPFQAHPTVRAAPAGPLHFQLAEF